MIVITPADILAALAIGFFVVLSIGLAWKSRK